MKSKLVQQNEEARAKLQKMSEDFKELQNRKREILAKSKSATKMPTKFESLPLDV